MLYTATLFMCLIGEPHSYDTCDLMNADFKFRTEMECQEAIAIRINQLYEHTAIFEKYELIEINCNEFGSNDKKL